ncbi:MAG TPA: MBL fold metallo-hydrolase [Nitrospirales bacterium]|jgi:UDP-MurNAc hydroxylase|nr:MBL fold metallo-hydrolase [Nitrospirales bacterium]
MQLEFLGHAGFIITQGGIRVACDPWLSPLGAYHAAWFQFPCNHHLGERDYRNLSAVVLTGEHPDHLDASFLSKKLSPDTPLIMPRHASRTFWNSVRQACANPIIEVKTGADHTVGDGLRVLFTADDTSDSQSCAVTFRTREAVLINMSEARFTPKQRDVLKVRTGGRIDALLVQGAGASWNPLCYRHSAERMTALSMVKRVEKLEYAYQALDQLAPRVGLPCGGPPVFLEESLAKFNDDCGGKGLVPDQKRAHDWLRQRGYQRRIEVLLPGDRLNLISGEFAPDEAIRREFSFERKDVYVKAYAERIRPAITEYVAALPRPTADLFEPFRSYVQRLGEKNDSLLKDLKMEIRFIVTGTHGGDFLVRCDAGELTVDQTGEQSAPCTLSFDAVWLNQIVHHRLPWKDFFQSLRFSVEQDPEVEDDHLKAWLTLTDTQTVPEPAATTAVGKPAHA